jgi:hypothetical protein
MLRNFLESPVLVAKLDEYYGIGRVLEISLTFIHFRFICLGYRLGNETSKMSGSELVFSF